MSPKIIPNAINNPNGETLLIFDDINATRSSFQNDGSLCMTCKSNERKVKRVFVY